MPQRAQEVATQVAIASRWTTALSTVIGSFGPRSWEDVENTVDHVLTGQPPVAPALRGGRSIERTLGGYESAHRIVLAGLSEVAPEVVLRWARLRVGLRGPEARTMMPVAGGAVEALLGDLAEMFGAPGRRVPVDVGVLEAMTEAAGLPASSLLVSAFRPGPDCQDALPSRACQTLYSMRGYDDALVRHAAVLRLHILGFEAHGQVRSARMLAQASASALQAYSEVVVAMGDSLDAAVRAAARPLARRLETSGAGALADLLPVYPADALPDLPARAPGRSALGRRLAGDPEVPGLDV